jgi:UDP-2,3-diacylglucosamine hydrolase
MKPRLFLSDLHLSPDRPQAAAAFRAFCEGPARGAAAVYILGDLFDWWIGDDQLADRFVADVAAAIRGVTQAGVPVHFAHGNRDFLLGDRFAAATGASLLPERQVLDLDGTPTLISHGDELCTGDVEYQRYRARIRDPATKRRLMRLPLFVRRLIARSLRRKSRNATAMKPESIMDVDDGAVLAAFRDYDVRRLIHGHTHRPATHVVDVDGRACERVVLADWHEGGYYVEVDGEGVRRKEIKQGRGEGEPLTPDPSPR